MLEVLYLPFSSTIYALFIEHTGYQVLIDPVLMLNLRKQQKTSQCTNLLKFVSKYRQNCPLLPDEMILVQCQHENLTAGVSRMCNQCKDGRR